MKTLIAVCLFIFLANFALSSEAAPTAATCPEQRSHAEFDLLLTQGPAYVHGVPASACLQAVIDREKQVAPKMSDKLLVQVLMDAAWKAESARLPQSL